MKRIVRVVLVVIAVISYIVIVLCGFGMLIWYAGWLDEHFLPSFLALIAAIITLPSLPIVGIVEWIWHGFPWELGTYWLLAFIAYWIAGAMIHLRERLGDKTDIIEY